MYSVVISLLAFALICAGAMLGAWLRKTLPGHHLDGDAKDIVRLGAGLLATISALVLGLLITSAKGSFDTQGNHVREMTAQIELLDLLHNRTRSKSINNPQA